MLQNKERLGREVFYKYAYQCGDDIMDDMRMDGNRWMGEEDQAMGYIEQGVTANVASTCRWRTQDAVGYIIDPTGLHRCDWPVDS